VSTRRQWLIFTAIVFIGSGRAPACTCSDPTAEAQESVAEYADIVFVGEVEQVSLVTHRGLEVVRATFKVLKMTKGPKTDSIQIVVHHGGTSCDLVRADFKVGDRYLLSGNKVIWSSEKDREAAGVGATQTLYYNNYCDLREKLDEAPYNQGARHRAVWSNFWPGATTLMRFATPPHTVSPDGTSPAHTG
jgi:hypothetical protein